MGNKYVVTAWGQFHGSVYYTDEIIYDGRSIVVAIYTMIKYKRKGFGCITFEWR